MCKDAGEEERPIAENVAAFQVERIPVNGDGAVLVHIILGMSSGSDKLLLETRVRVGGGL